MPKHENHILVFARIEKTKCVYRMPHTRHVKMGILPWEQACRKFDNSKSFVLKR